MLRSLEGLEEPAYFPEQHILNSDGKIPAAYRQQVWGQGGLSKDVKSMEESLMSFP